LLRYSYHTVHWDNFKIFAFLKLLSLYLISEMHRLWNLIKCTTALRSAFSLASPVYLLSSKVSCNYTPQQHVQSLVSRYMNSLSHSHREFWLTGMRIGGLHAITNPSTKPSGQLAYFHITFDVLFDRLNLAIRAKTGYNITGSVDRSAK